MICQCCKEQVGVGFGDTSVVGKTQNTEACGCLGVWRFVRSFTITGMFHTWWSTFVGKESLITNYDLKQPVAPQIMNNEGVQTWCLGSQLSGFDGKRWLAREKTRLLMETTGFRWTKHLKESVFLDGNTWKTHFRFLIWPKPAGLDTPQTNKYCFFLFGCFIPPGGCSAQCPKRQVEDFCKSLSENVEVHGDERRVDGCGENLGRKTGSDGVLLLSFLSFLSFWSKWQVFLLFKEETSI